MCICRYSARGGASGSGAMATPKALFSLQATWSEDDSDEEEHFREMVRLPHSPRGAVQRRARRERARASTARSHLGRAPEDGMSGAAVAGLGRRRERRPVGRPPRRVTEARHRDARRRERARARRPAG